MSRVNETLDGLRREVETVGRETVTLLQSTDRLVKDSEAKLHSFDPICESVRNTGEVLQEVTGTVKQVSAAVSRSAAGISESMIKHQNRLSDVAEFASLGFQIWQKWHDQRTAKTKAEQTQSNKRSEKDVKQSEG